jgi:cyclic pyranopterin monophosphate synthase
MQEFSHIDTQGKARMVDVGNKSMQYRIAEARGFIRLSPYTVELIKKNEMKKGDVLTLSEIAGIQAAKQTSILIPLCHQIHLTQIQVKCLLQENGVKTESLVKSFGQTGAEMEALSAVSVSLLCIYDMCKAVDKNMIIEKISLLNKSKSDHYV